MVGANSLFINFVSDYCNTSNNNKNVHPRVAVLKNSHYSFNSMLLFFQNQKIEK